MQHIGRMPYVTAANTVFYQANPGYLGGKLIPIDSLRVITMCNVYHDTTRCEVDIDSIRVITRCNAYHDTTRCEADIDSVRVITRCKVYRDTTWSVIVLRV